MEISFYILDVIRPRLLEDFLKSKTRWTHCKIVVTKCASQKNYENQTLYFRGPLPSWAPYFTFTTKVNFLKTPKTVAPTNTTYPMKFAVRGTNRLTTDYRRFLCDEVRVRTGKEIKGLDRQDFDSNYKTFGDLASYKVFYNNCDYYRLGREQIIRSYFPETPAEKIWKMSIEQMKKLIDNFLTKKPWLFMFPWLQKTFGLKNVRYKNMVGARNFYKVVPPREHRIGMEFYNFVLAKRDESGDTFFTTDKLVEEFTRNKCPDFIQEELRTKALGFLSFKGLWFFDPEQRDTFVLLSDKERIEEVWKIFLEIRERGEDAEIEKVATMPGLTDEQSQAVAHVQNNWLTMILGSPGHGKSQAIVAIVKQYPRVLVCTYVGMAVDMLKKRLNGYEHLYTIHYIYYRCMFDDMAESWLEQFDILVVDEFSNVDIKLCWHLLKCISHFIRVVFVGDLEQINPISPGIPFRDLVEAFPESVFYFTQNLRADKDAHALVDAAIHVKNNELDKIDFASHCLQLLPRPKGEDAVAQVLSAQLPTHAYDMMNYQIICLTRKQRNEINLFVETWLIEHGVVQVGLNSHRLRGNLRLFRGQKITFTKNIKKPGPDSKYAGVRNGELACIEKIGKDKRRNAITLKLSTGKIICIGDGENQIPAINIDRGYAITCNKSQGSEWPHVLFWIHEGLREFWTREYLYVAISRAKSSVHVVGQKEELQQMCAQKSPERTTYLSRLIETTMREEANSDNDSDSDDTMEEWE